MPYSRKQVQQNPVVCRKCDPDQTKNGVQITLGLEIHVIRTHKTINLLEVLIVIEQQRAYQWHGSLTQVCTVTHNKSLFEPAFKIKHSYLQVVITSLDSQVWNVLCNLHKHAKSYLESLTLYNFHSQCPLLLKRRHYEV